MVASRRIPLISCHNKSSELSAADYCFNKLNEQISGSEYVSKNHILDNRKPGLEGKFEAYELKRDTRFEPSIQFVSETKQTAFLLAEGNCERNRDFRKEIGSNFRVA